MTTFYEILLPLNRWPLLKTNCVLTPIKSISWVFGHDWENDILKGFSIDFLKILMVPPSFAQILSWKIIKEKVFGDERRFLFFFKKWCTEAYIRSRVHEYKVILCPDEPHPCVFKSRLLSEVIASHSLKPWFPSEITESHLLKRWLPPEMTVSH